MTTRHPGMEAFVAYWIIGYGRVGRRALERLLRKSPDTEFIVVDTRLPGSPESFENVRWHTGDGVAFVVDRLRGVTAAPSPWIVPALPRHLAFEWFSARLGETYEVETHPVPETLVAQLPNAVVGPEGQVYISNADFICRESCSEPQGRCPVTGRPRPFDLYERLAEIRWRDYRSVVVRSFQLAPGVGGFRGHHLAEALHIIQAQSGNYLLSTASKCHGVMHAFSTADQRSRIKEQK